MVLDHLDAPSRVVTGMIKDLHYYGRTPVLFASRSPHMEDIGACARCARQVGANGLRNLPPQIALEFAQREADRIELQASNLGSTLSSLVEWSSGTPRPPAHVEDGTARKVQGGRSDQIAHPVHRLSNGPALVSEMAP